MSNKVKLIISGILFIVFCVALYSTLNNKPKNRNVKQPRCITIKQNEDEEKGFKVYILLKGGNLEREKISVDYFYNGRLINTLETNIYNKGYLIDEGYFEVEYQENYVKLNILDYDKKITGTFRAYIEKNSENDAYKDGE